MTLTEQCQGTKALIEKRNAGQKAHANSEVFRQRATDLQGIRVGIAANLALVEVLKQHGTKLNKLPPVAAAKSAKEAYATALTADPLASSKEHAQFKRSIQKVSNDVAVVVREVLSSVERELPSSDETFLKQVEVLPQYKATVDEIRRRRQELLGGRSIHDRSPTELDALLSKREQLRELANSLLPEEFPQSVLDFYKVARRKDGAALDALTPEVRDWLAKRKLLQNVRLFMKD
jgi:hypothetical protein